MILLYLADFLLFAVDMQKMTFLMPFALIFMYYVISLNEEKICNYLHSFMMVCILILSLVLYIFQDDEIVFTLAAIVLLRTVCVAAIIDHEIVGMAGASADSPSFWQIGINVNKNFEGRYIATGLVSILKADILQKGFVPYYGTSFSNLASQHVAAKAGFEVAWVELITERNDEL